MSNHSVSAAKAVQAVASTKNSEDGFSQRSGMCEKPRGRTGRKKILELLGRTIGNDGNHFDEALSLFHDLSYKQKLKAMRKMEKRLMEVRGYAFSNEDNARAVQIIADFFFKAAQYFPTNEEGEKIIKPIKGATKTLENIASQTEHDKEPYSQMRIACLRALWELDCGAYSFWEGQLIGDGTNKETEDFVITTLLEHQTENFEDNGWNMLIRNLEKLGTAIARNTSPKKADFLRLMLKDSNPEVVSNALEASLHLESIPEDFLEAAHEMSQSGENGTEQETSGLMQKLDDVLNNTREKAGLGKAADDFLRIANLKNQLREDGDARFEAALELIQIFGSGASHLSDLLKQTGDEMAGMLEEPASKTEKQQWEQQMKALNALLCLSDVGINDPLQSVVDNLLEAEAENSQEFLREYLGVLGGFVAYSPSTKKVGFLKEMVMDEQPEVGLNAFASVASSSSLHQEFIDLAYEMLEDDKKQQLWGPIHNFLHAAHTTMATGGSRNGTYLLGTIVLHESAGSSEKIEAIRALLKSENPHKARHGFAAAPYLKEIPKDLIDLAYGMLEDDKKKHLREGIHNFLHTVHISTARNDPAAKRDIGKMLKDKNPHVVRHGFAAALYLKDIPKSFTNIAQSVIDDKKKEPQDAAADFIRIKDLKDDLVHGYDSKVTAATTELIDLYIPTRYYLRPMLEEAAAEMAEILADPMGKTEKEKAEQQNKTLQVIARLAMAGIQTPGVPVDFKFEEPTAESPSEEITESPTRIITEAIPLKPEILSKLMAVHRYTEKDYGVKEAPRKLEDHIVKMAPRKPEKKEE